MPKTKAPAEAGATEQKPRIPTREWVVYRRCLRSRREAPIARFTAPSYAKVFRNALGGYNPSADLIFHIKEEMFL